MVQEQTARMEPETELCSEIFHHRGLAHKYCNCPCNEEGWNQTQNNMFLSIPLHQVDGLHQGIIESLIPSREIEASQKHNDEDSCLLPLFLPIHSNILYMSIAMLRPPS
jgi:hypothetical protein